MTAVAELGVDDANFLQSYLIQTRVYGVVVPAGSPPEFLATYEIQGDQGVLVIAVAVGEDGEPGGDAFALSLQDDTIDDPADLPEMLTPADMGKYWIIDDVDVDLNIIGSSLYVWYGTKWRRLMLGTPGPQGPVPIITPTLSILSPGQVSTVEKDGSDFAPTLEFDLSLPAGLQGPAAALALCPDVDLTTHAPVAGDVLGHTGDFVGGYLSAPSGLVGVAAGAGGTLAAGNWFYVVTAVNAAGETTVSNEFSVTTSGSTSKVTLVWLQAGSGHFGPTNYKLYRGSLSGGENKLIGTVSGTTLSFIDTGITGTTASPPTLNTATVDFPLWVPVSISQLLPSPYSMPESSFTSFSGISQAAGIGSFAIPPQSFPWTPLVWGHIGAFGIELSANPLMIGCEVLLGNPTTGSLIGRGFGNTLGEVNIAPHYSAPGAPGVAITPTNGLGVVPANHTNPAQGTIYVSLFNDGAIGLYQFSPTDAQIFVFVVPV